MGHATRGRVREIDRARGHDSSPVTHDSSPLSVPSPQSSVLIVNADDFGISEGVNRAVADAYEHGILTSATLMANMPAFEDAVRVAREHPLLGVGVHLNLTSGTPVLHPERVSGLTGPDGYFPPMGTLLRGLTQVRFPPAQLEAELSAQIEKVIAAGITVTHLDSHHHVHAHPALHAVVIRLARRYGIRAIRSTAELSLAGVAIRLPMLFRGVSPASPASPPRPATPLETPRSRYSKSVALSLLGLLLDHRAHRAGIATPDHFRGLILGTAFSTGALLTLLDNLPDGVTELMCHPGYPDEALHLQTSYAAGRESELAALLDPRAKARLEQQGVRLSSFGDQYP